MGKIDHQSLNVTQEANLRRYATLGLGTAVLAGAVTTTDAAVVYTNFNNTVLSDPATTDTDPVEYSVYLANNGTMNVVAGGSAGIGTNVMDFFIRNEGAGNGSNYAVITAGVNGGTTHPLNFLGITSSSNGNVFRYPSRLAAGTSVGPTRSFVTVAGTSQSLQGGTLAFGAGFPNSKWAKSGANSGYLGISFLGTDNATHYAFLQMTVALNSDTNARSVTLIGAGYENAAGTAITTAPQAVPEPSSLALLAAGGLGGVAAFRQRRKKTALPAA